MIPFYLSDLIRGVSLFIYFVLACIITVVDFTMVVGAMLGLGTEDLVMTVALTT